MGGSLRRARSGELTGGRRFRSAARSSSTIQYRSHWTSCASGSFIIESLLISFPRAVSAPLNPAYSQSEISFCLKDTQSSVLLIASPSGAEPAAIKAGKECGVKVVAVIPEGKAGIRLEVVYEPERKDGKTLGVVANKNQGDGSEKVLEGDVALVLHTSGTTGRPKGERVSQLCALVDAQSPQPCLLPISIS